jgi:hypothetical protein
MSQFFTGRHALLRPAPHLLAILFVSERNSLGVGAAMERPSSPGEDEILPSDLEVPKTVEVEIPRADPTPSDPGESAR